MYVHTLGMICSMYTTAYSTQHMTCDSALSYHNMQNAALFLFKERKFNQLRIWSDV
jgi:hypothetical protein